MKPSDIGALVTVDDVRLSPDAAHVAFTVTTVDLEANRYRHCVWVGAADGSRSPEPFTAGAHGDSSPRWSPDGGRLAFISHRGEDPDNGATIHVAPFSGGGEVRTLVEWDDVVDALEWSPDGTSLAFGARTPDSERVGKKTKDQPPYRLSRLFQRIDSVGWLRDRPRHLHVVAADGSATPRAVTEGDLDTVGLAWSPDSAALAYVAAAHDDWDLDLLNDVWLAPIEEDAGPPRRVTATETTWDWPVFSPDGSRLAVVLRGDPWLIVSSLLEVVEVATGARTPLTPKLDRTIHHFGASQAPVWAGDDVAFIAEDGPNVHVFRVPADGSAPPRVVVGGDRCAQAFDVSGALTAIVVSDQVSLPEVIVVDPDGDERTLTNLGRNFSARIEVAPAETFVATAPDGTEVEGWYIRPPGAEAATPLPTLLSIHGGPFSAYGNRFFDEFQLAAGAGYGVVYTNPRGSSGMGDAWGQAVAWPTHPVHPGSGWGGVDADDLLAVLDEAVKRFDTIDPDRLGVLGGSYGGYMTSWLLAHDHRFKAGCSERAVNDLLKAEGDSDIASWFSGYTGVSHLEHPEAFSERSPLTYADQIETPLLILHSEGDQRCPVGQADALFTALRMLRRPVEMVRFLGESHELSRSGAPRHRVQRAEAILEWFDRWLKPPPAEGTHEGAS